MVIGIDASRAFVTERTGTEEYSYQLITRMLKLPMAKTHQFVLFIRPGTRMPKELVGYSNVRVKVIPFKYLWTQLGLAWETWQTPLDVLWIPAHTLPVLRKPKLVTVVTIHGLEYKYLPEYQNVLQRWYLPLSTYYAARSATKLIAVSESTKRELLQEVTIDPDKIQVILEGTEVKSKIQDQESVNVKVWLQYNLLPKKYILFVGTVQPRKNLVSLIKAFKEFYSTHPDYKLVIAGAIGWQAETDLALPEKLGIPEVVIFAGRVSAEVLQALYQGANIYVQPSWTEGFGIPVVEAMGAGVPTIVSDGGALPEVVASAGIVVPLSKRFVSNLAKALVSLNDSDSRRRELIKAGLSRVGELTWDRTAQRTLTLLTRG